MGPRYLYTYMNKSVPDGIINIDIQQEAEKYRRTCGRDPIIILDPLALQDKMYTSDHEVCLGGRYNVYNERARELFSKFKSLGIKLVFCIDGTPQTCKMATCLERRNNKYNNMFKVLQYIDSGRNLAKNVRVEIPHLIPFFRNFKRIAKEFGDVHVATFNECDLEIADLANVLGAMAIISNDTDFLIYEGNWHYWSSKHMNIKNLRTVEFNRHALRKHLSLDSNYMSLLATLAGNDILKYDYVRHFHRNIIPNRRFGDQFQAIASFIKNLRSYPQLSKEDLEYVVRRIFKPAEWEEGTELIKESLKSYSYNAMKRKSENDISNVTTGKTYGFIYEIVNNCPKIIGLSYFDLTDKQFSSFYDLVFPLIRRQMGILLRNSPGENIRTFYYKKSHETEYEPYELRPDYPKCEVPPLNEFHSIPYGTNSDLDNLRLELVCWQISEKLNPKLLLSIPKEMLINVLVIFYLYEKKQITLEEADCLLLSVNCPPDVRNDLKIEEFNVINGRDAKIAHLFCRLYVNFANCFEVVGLKTIFDSLLTFDGLYYHHLRKYWTKEKGHFMAVLASMKKLRIYLEDFDNTLLPHIQAITI